MIEQNKDKRVTIRLNSQDYVYLQILSFMGGMNVSKYIRALCDASINALKLSVKQGKVNLEDVKALLDHQL